MPLGPERELVLVAEDDLANRALLARLLERAGYRSLAVADGGLPRDSPVFLVTARPSLLLAVEDEPRNAALLEAILGRAGYRLHVAGDLAQAREWLAETSPALVLLDRHLPDGDGLDLIGTIRGSDRLPRCRSCWSAPASCRRTKPPRSRPGATDSSPSPFA